MKQFIARLLPLIDWVLFPLVYPAAALLKAIRYGGIHRMPMCKKALLHVGIFPIRRHYYEPQFDFRDLSSSLSVERNLAGIDWNLQQQLNLLAKLDYRDELNDLNSDKATQQFHLNNGAFESGDAEVWYGMIRDRKPKTIIEIGSGFSTLMAIRAIDQNRQEDPAYNCEHICIEPYEHGWLEDHPVKVIRSKVESLDVSFFTVLAENDILFIDSSHIVRPQGDVVFEFLELLPTLKPGVMVHIHDIFSPRNYLESWLKNEVRFWNEQYLLEAFLTHNAQWRIVAALNFLHHNHYEQLSRVCPYLTRRREPGSFYIQRVA
jgi:hypothetical protein